MHVDKIFIFVNDRRISLTEFAAMNHADIKTVGETDARAKLRQAVGSAP